MADVLIGKLELPGGVQILPPQRPITAPPGVRTAIALKVQGIEREGVLPVEGDFEEAELRDGELLLHLRVPETEGTHLVQLFWEGGDLMIPLKVSQEHVVVESVLISEEGVIVELTGPRERRVRGDLRVELLGRGGKALSHWRRRVAVREKLELRAPLVVDLEGAELLRVTFTKGEFRSSKEVHLGTGEPPEEVKQPQEETSPAIIPPVDVKPPEEEKNLVRLSTSLKLPGGSENGLFPSESVERVFTVDSTVVKRLSSPTLLIEGAGNEEETTQALFTLLYLSEGERKRLEEFRRVLSGLTQVYGEVETAESEDLKWLSERIFEVASGSGDAFESLSARVEGRLKELKNAEVIGEEEALRNFREEISASRKEIEEISGGLSSERLSTRALSRAVAAELYALLGALKYFFLWDRGVWREYPSLGVKERKLISGAVEMVEGTLKRLERVSSIASRVVSRNKQNRVVREALGALSTMEAEVEGLDGTLESGGRATGFIRLKTDRPLSIHITFQTSSNLALRRPLASYSGGILKSGSIKVEGESTIPVEVELLKRGGERGTLQISIVPELPPLLRELEEVNI